MCSPYKGTYVLGKDDGKVCCIYGKEEGIGHFWVMKKIEKIGESGKTWS